MGGGNESERERERKRESRREVGLKERERAQDRKVRRSIFTFLYVSSWAEASVELRRESMRSTVSIVARRENALPRKCFPFVGIGTAVLVRGAFLLVALLCLAHRLSHSISHRPWSNFAPSFELRNLAGARGGILQSQQKMIFRFTDNKQDQGHSQAITLLNRALHGVFLLSVARNSSMNVSRSEHWTCLF